MTVLIRLQHTLTIITLTTLLLAGERGAASSIDPANIKDSFTGMEFVFVPGGCFTSGANDGNSDEKPTHEVCLSTFYIGKFEVTQKEWQRVMGSNPSQFSSCGDSCPVEQVSWSDAQEFIFRLNRMTGNNYRLPTEAEWEFACRGGGKAETYCGSSDVSAVAWIDSNSSNSPHPVGKKSPNRLGLFDMSGNVWEWVQDWNGKYPAERQENPLGPASGSSRVRRGGSWQYDAAKSRAPWRSSGYQDDRAFDIGFRLAHPGKKHPEK